MKSLNTLQTLSRLGRVLSKIAFVCSLVGFCGCIAGIVSEVLQDENVIRIGGVTLHGILEKTGRYNDRELIAAMSAWLIVCAGEAVIARFAQIYFWNEIKRGTPFTDDGADELKRLGIITLAVSLGCSALAEAVQELVAGSVGMVSFEGGTSAALGIMFIVGSVMCRYGAEACKV